MALRAIMVVLITIFAVVVGQSLLAQPVVDVTSSLNETGDYSGLDGVSGYDGNSIITGITQDWLNMGLIAVFGVLGWAGARIVRRELTRGRL